MADDAKSTPATATASGAAAPSPKKPKLGPIGKVLAKLDAEIADAKEVADALGKRKSDVQKAISFAKAQNMSEEATLAIVQQLIPATESKPSTSKRGRPKGSKSKGKHKGGRGVTISEATIAKIKEMGKKGETAYAVSKKVGVSPKTAAKYLK